MGYDISNTDPSTEDQRNYVNFGLADGISTDVQLIVVHTTAVVSSIIPEDYQMWEE